jgi:hypothetical protein
LSEIILCDECKAGGFLLAASSVPCSNVKQLRAVVNGLLLTSQIRLHFVAESSVRRKQILREFVSFGGIQTIIYDARHLGDKEGRDTAVAQMAADAAAIPASRIILEADDSVVAADRAIIRQQLEKAGVVDQVGCDHLRARDEPLLAIPDAVAWCAAKGGEWRRLAAPLITDVVSL